MLRIPAGRLITDLLLRKSAILETNSGENEKLLCLNSAYIFGFRKPPGITYFSGKMEIRSSSSMWAGNWMKLCSNSFYDEVS